MKRRPGLRFVVRFDTATAASTADGPEATATQEYMKQFGPGPHTVTLEHKHVIHIVTAAKNAESAHLTTSDAIAFTKRVEAWCVEHCQGDFDIFVPDVYAANNFGYFAIDADAAAFAIEFRGKRGRHPMKREESGLLGREARFDLTAEMVQATRTTVPTPPVQH